ncbi:hypothetical protein [Streptomyces sp. SID4985]|uniref:hypothetical protein n=1 Tax=Streptomyces sp. SID4985 TaxID=2690292 RepID=UPI0019272E27|nr:hypothetical protein [Streptomyces sp. SID4985]
MEALSLGHRTTGAHRRDDRRDPDHPGIDSPWNRVNVHLAATNAAGRSVSSSLYLTTAPYAAPAFTEQPRDLAAIQGTDASVAFRATGNPAIDPNTFVLECSSDNGTTWRTWSGAQYTDSGEKFTIPAIPLDADGNLARIRAANTDALLRLHPLALDRHGLVLRFEYARSHRDARPSRNLPHPSCGYRVTEPSQRS